MPRSFTRVLRNNVYLRCERLETRDAPATFTVNDPGTAGAANAKKSEMTTNNTVTLQSAFDRMNFLGGTHTIKFSGPMDIGGSFYSYFKGGATINGIAGGPGGPQVKIHATIQVGSGSDVHDLYVSGAQGSGIIVGSGSKVHDNVASGNGQYGIYLQGSGSKATHNIVGLMPDGTTPQPNQLDGVLLFGGSNTVGGTSAGDRNIISGNLHNGINMFSSDGPFASNNNAILGNYIGVTLDGSTPVPNKFFGVVVQGNSNRVGGMSPGEGNLIVAANGGDGGVRVNQGNGVSTGTKIQKNLIGTKVDGLSMFTPESDDPGAQTGIDINGGTAFTVIQANTIADSEAGISIGGGKLTGTQIVGNMIGVSSDGQTRLRNAEGIDLINAQGITIGGSSAGTRNIISGNQDNGIELLAGSSDNKIYGNYIGTNFAGDDLGNGIHGVEIFGGDDNFIGFTSKTGAPTSSFANTIAFNGNDWAKKMTADQRGNAVQIDSGGGDTIRGNIFHDNKALSIYLFDPDHQNELPQNDVAVAHFDKKADRTVIDSLADSDFGANNLQNFPVIESIDTSKKQIVWQLNNDRKNAAYTVDFYVDSTLGDLGYGEGQKYLMTKTLHTDATGHGDDVEIPLVPGQYVSATATDPDGNTSSFSIVDTRGDGIADAWITKGIDFDMTGKSILTLPNADLTRRNIYIQMDVMSGVIGNGDSISNVFNTLKQVFNNSPVLNANGTSGVNLQINPDGGPQSIPFSADWANTWTDFDNSKTQFFGAGLNDVQKKARAMVYRYGVFINQFGADTSSGLAEATIVNNSKAPNGLGYEALGGNDFMVALPANWWSGSKTPLNTVTEQDLEGTMMHELGHTLGLLHGGTDLENYKPNYYSIMNYDWQMPGMRYRTGAVNTDYSSSWTLDYSRKAINKIDENATGNFDIGLNVNLSVPVPKVFVSSKTGWYIGPGNKTVSYRLVPMSGPVPRVTILPTDPNYAKLGLNGKADVNFGGDADLTKSLTTLLGAEDWSHLIYNFRESPSYADGQHGSEQNELTNDFAGPPAADSVVTGSDAGSTSRVQVIGTDGKVAFDFPAFPGFSGGVRVAKGDVNGDGTPDIIAAMGPGGDTVAVFDGKTANPIMSTQPYGKGYTGGMNVAAGDVDGDGHVEIIVAPASGVGSNVLVLDGMTGGVKRTILAYTTTTKTGVTVAAGDVNGDGKMDIIVGPASGAGPLVKIFNGPDGKFMKSFAIQSPAYNGVFLAAADLNGDGKADIIAGAGGGAGAGLMPLVRIYSGANPATILMTYAVDDATFHGGVRVGVVQNSDGDYDVVTTTGPGEQPTLARFHGLSLSDSFELPLFDNTFSGAFVG
jgi:parallel beta-helix repeat protein